MGEGMTKFVGALTVAGVACLLVYKAYDAYGPLLYIVPIAVVLVLGTGFWLFTSLEQERAEAAISQGVATDAPMRVELRSERIRDRKHRLYIDITMSPKDWAAIKGGGFDNYLLFRADKVTKFDDFYAVAHLLRVKYVDFDDAAELEHAKGRLIENLKDLRSNIERFQNKQQYPEERRETHEI